MMNYTIKTWLNENSRPEIRTGIPYALAYALATKGGYYKAQVISEEFNTVEFETRNDYDF